MMAKVHKAIDSMIGIHLNAHVMSTWELGMLNDHQLIGDGGGYEFLMQNCEKPTNK